MVLKIRKSGNAKVKREDFEEKLPAHKLAKSALGKTSGDIQRSHEVKEDMKSIIDAATDYEQICSLLFPHLDSAEKPCNFEGLLKREVLKKREAAAFHY